MYVDGAKPHIKDGKFSTTEEPQEYVFSPKRVDIDGIIIYEEWKPYLRGYLMAY